MKVEFYIINYLLQLRSKIKYEEDITTNDIINDIIDMIIKWILEKDYLIIISEPEHIKQDIIMKLLPKK